MVDFFLMFFFDFQFDFFLTLTFPVDFFLTIFLNHGFWPYHMKVFFKFSQPFQFEGSVSRRVVFHLPDFVVFFRPWSSLSCRCSCFFPW